MRTGITDLLRRLAARPQGFDTSDNELGGWTTEKSGTVANRLVAQGELFKVKVSHKVVRYFDTQAKADLYAASKVKPVKNVSVRTLAQRAPLEWAGQPGIETANTIKIICPPYRPRFQAVDLAGIHSGLQSGRVLKTAT